MIPLVAASEGGRGQTVDSDISGVVGLAMSYFMIETNRLERRAIDGDSPVVVGRGGVVST